MQNSVLEGTVILTKENFKSNVRNTKEMWLVAFIKDQWNSGIKSKWNQAAVELKAKFSKSWSKFKIITCQKMSVMRPPDCLKQLETPHFRPWLIKKYITRNIALHIMFVLILNFEQILETL